LALKPRLAPATLILRSRFPVLSIWQKNTGRPTSGSTWRPRRADRPEGLRPRVAPFPKGGHTLARHLKGRLTLAEAVTATQAIDPDVDASAILTLFLSARAH
jgi:hypothetical protein